MKSFKISKVILSSLVEVLNRSKYDGIPLRYSVIPLDDSNDMQITFEQNVSGNYFHGRMEEAKCIKMERDTKSRLPINTKKMAQNKNIMKKLEQEYGCRNYKVMK